MINFKVNTQHKIALDSLDHKYPTGTKNDNNTMLKLIPEIEFYCKRKKEINFCDLGCAGGQFAVDFSHRGHNAIGLEGSDYGIVNHQFNWPKYYEKILFTCDLEYPFDIVDALTNELIKFDCISIWEVLEHINPKRLDNILKNIYRHLDDAGILIGSISLIPCILENRIDLHQSRFTLDEWVTKIFPKNNLKCLPYPFMNFVNAKYIETGYSFAFCAAKDDKKLWI